MPSFSHSLRCSGSFCWANRCTASNRGRRSRARSNGSLTSLDPGRGVRSPSKAGRSRSSARTARSTSSANRSNEESSRSRCPVHRSWRSTARALGPRSCSTICRATPSQPRSARKGCHGGPSPKARTYPTHSRRDRMEGYGGGPSSKNRCTAGSLSGRSASAAAGLEADPRGPRRSARRATCAASSPPPMSSRTRDGTSSARLPPSVPLVPAGLPRSTLSLPSHGCQRCANLI